ncbi:DUF1801 domain-containing protein [Vulgatibacter sp.]|uniref:DUF1801 domain-containing protein n=1 Tax=Vulgatibacter sp. TaxID=1971226 RepID=UPI003567C567
MRSKSEKATSAKKSPTATQTDPAVAALLESLEHPLRAEIESVRRILLGVDPAIREAVKWNAPSFRTSDFFATFNLRSKNGVQLVFHTGAKVKATATTGIDVDDPAGLLDWRAKDRALVTLGAGAQIEENRAAFEALVRSWIRWL